MRPLIAVNGNLLRKTIIMNFKEEEEKIVKETTLYVFETINKFILD